MRTRSPGRPRSPLRGTWSRHAGAAGAAVVINAGLILFLSGWARRDRGPAPSPLRAVPVAVVQLETEPLETPREQPLESLAPAAPAAADLPAPPVPDLPAQPLRLEAPALPSTDAESIRLADVPAELPPFVVQPAGLPAAPRPPAGSGQPGPREVAATRGPMLIEPPDLSDYYPRRARMRGITGRTTVSITIGRDGRVSDVQVLSSAPEGVFETAAKRVSRTLVFHPALRDGRPVPARTSLNLIWKLEE